MTVAGASRRARGRPTRRRGGDEGSTLPLIVVFGAIALALVLVVAAATGLYLERKRLFTLADGAALVGAESFALDGVRPGPAGGLRPRLEPGQVHDAVEAYLASEPADDVDGLHLDAATTTDGRSAVVSLSSQWRPPVLTVFVPDGIRISVTATARSVFDR